MVRYGFSCLIFLLLGALPGAASAQDPYYKGKTLSFLVGAPPGGGFDTMTRIVARHLGRHTPGNPIVVVQNMTGAGTVIAANHLYNRSKPDGLTIGVWVGSLTLAKFMGGPGLEFDPLKFEWIGVPVQQTMLCAFTKASGISSMDKWYASKTPVKMGGQVPGTRPDDISSILKVALNLPIQLVQGYKGTADITMAAEAGELAGQCTSWQGLKSSWRRQYESGDVHVVVQTNRKPIPELPNVPLAITYAKTDEARQLIEVGIHDLNAITLAYSAPPGTPKDKVQTLRSGVWATLKDPAFLADAKAAQQDVDPISGEDLANIIAGFKRIPGPVMAKLAEILLPKK
jgi:tripartite-type tricarboxylate transporter receptor subunit TctC